MLFCVTQEETNNIQNIRNRKGKVRNKKDDELQFRKNLLRADLEKALKSRTRDNSTSDKVTWSSRDILITACRRLISKYGFGL